MLPYMRNLCNWLKPSVLEKGRNTAGASICAQARHSQAHKPHEGEALSNSVT